MTKASGIKFKDPKSEDGYFLYTTSNQAIYYDIGCIIGQEVQNTIEGIDEIELSVYRDTYNGSEVERGALRKLGTLVARIGGIAAILDAENALRAMDAVLAANPTGTKS